MQREAAVARSVGQVPQQIANELNMTVIPLLCT